MKLKYYYVRRGEELFGPAKPNQLIDAATNGIIRPTDEISLNRDGPWQLALTCVEFGFDDRSRSYIVWEGIERHGPYTLLQMYEMMEHGDADWNTNVADIDGRMTKLGQLLQLPAPKDSAVSEMSQHSDNVPIFKEIVPPTSIETTPEDIPSEPPEEQPPKDRELDLQMIEALLREEQTAKPTQSTRSAEKKLPPRRQRKQRRPKKRQESQPSAKSRSQQSPSTTHELTFSNSIRKAVRSPQFERRYQILAMAISLFASVYIFLSSLLISQYIVRVFFLTIEVFVPFESSTEVLQESDLILAGIALVCLTGELLLPLFSMIKAETDFRLWAILTAFAALICQAVDSTQLVSLTTLVKFLCVAAGILIAGGGLAITYLTQHRQWTIGGLLVSLATLGVSLMLGMLSTTDTLILEIDQLPPTLTGNIWPAFLIGFCLLGILLPVPMYVLRMISTQTDRSTKTYLHTWWWGIIGGSIFCLASIGLIAGTVGPRFLNLPISLFPIMLGTVIISLLQSLLWLLHPARVLR